MSPIMKGSSAGSDDIEIVGAYACNSGCVSAGKGGHSQAQHSCRSMHCRRDCCCCEGLAIRTLVGSNPEEHKTRIFDPRILSKFQGQSMIFLVFRMLFLAPSCGYTRRVQDETNHAIKKYLLGLMILDPAQSCKPGSLPSQNPSRKCNKYTAFAINWKNPLNCAARGSAAQCNYFFVTTCA